MREKGVFEKFRAQAARQRASYQRPRTALLLEALQELDEELKLSQIDAAWSARGMLYVDDVLVMLHVGGELRCNPADLSARGVEAVLLIRAEQL